MVYASSSSIYGSDAIGECDDFYHANDEGGLAWNAPEIGIEWPKVEGIGNGFSFRIDLVVK